MNQNITSLNLPRNEIAELQNSGYNYCDEIPENFQLNRELLKAPETKTALQLYQEEVVNGCILTFNENLDSILKNEIVPRTITELAGYPGSGKTQICFNLCISVQLPTWCGGVNGESLYISTNKKFSVDRLKEISTSFVQKYENLKRKANVTFEDFSEESILKHIHCIEVDDYIELLACINCLDEYLKDKNVKLLVIDSITYPIRLLEGNERVVAVYKIFRRIQALSSLHNFSIVVCNDLTTRIYATEILNPPALGDSFHHSVNTRILLSKEASNVFEAKVVKSILQAPKTVKFIL